MKKILLLAVLLTPCIPSMIVGCKSQQETTEHRRSKMLDAEFEKWCKSQGYNTALLTEHQKDVLFLDVWSETYEYSEVVDSIDSVLSITNQVLTDK